MRGALVLAVVACGLILALRSRFAGLLLYLWFALFRPQEWAWESITALRLSSVIAIVLIVPALATGVWPNVTHPLSVGTLAFLAIAGIAQIGAIDPDRGSSALYVLGVSVVVSLLMVRLIETRKQYVTVVAVLAGSLAFYSAKYGIGYLLRGGAEFSIGTGGMFGGNNEFGVAIARIVPLLLAVVQNAASWTVAAGFVLAVPLSALGIVSTFSRGSFLSLAAGAFVFVLLQRRRALALTGLSLAMAIALLVVPIPESYVNRLETIQTYEEVGEDSAKSRPHFWRVATIMVRDHPFGVGLKNFEANFNRYDFLDGRYGTSRDVHSTHFQVLAETGYLGFAVYAALIAAAVFFALRARARSKHPGLDRVDRRFLFTTANALIVSICAFLVGGSFNSLLLNDLNWYTFALVAALDRVSLQMIRGAVAAEDDRVAA